MWLKSWTFNSLAFTHEDKLHVLIGQFSWIWQLNAAIRSRTKADGGAGTQKLGQRPSGRARELTCAERHFRTCYFCVAARGSFLCLYSGHLADPDDYRPCQRRLCVHQGLFAVWFVQQNEIRCNGGTGARRKAEFSTFNFAEKKCILENFPYVDKPVFFWLFFFRNKLIYNI